MKNSILILVGLISSGAQAYSMLGCKIALDKADFAATHVVHDKAQKSFNESGRIDLNEVISSKEQGEENYIRVYQACSPRLSVFAPAAHQRLESLHHAYLAKKQEVIKDWSGIEVNWPSYNKTERELALISALADHLQVVAPLIEQTLETR